MADKCLCHAYFEGVYDKQIKQGQDFDLAQGVRAIDGYGNEVDFTYEPTEIDLCKTGDQEVTYKAFGASFNIVPKLCMPKYKRGVSIPEDCSSDLEMITAKRIIRIIRASNPRFLGIPRVFINENDAFDPTEGVTAIDDNGNEIDFSYEGKYDLVAEGDGITTFETEYEQDAKAAKVALEPIQDLNGYDKPWAGGAGKNKLQVTTTSQTINGITLTVNDDGTIKANGTATANIDVTVGSWVSDGTSIIGNGCPSGGSTSTYRLFFNRVGSDVGSGTAEKTLAVGTAVDVRLLIYSGQTVSNLIFKPMIRLSTASADFEPYSNICPISGHDEVTVETRGKNLCEVFIDGYVPSINNGELVSAVGARSNFVPILPNTRYTFSASSSVTMYTFYYDKDKHFLSYQNGTSVVSYNSPSNSAFAMLRVGDSSISGINFQFEQGDRTDYEPYEGDTYTTTLGRTVYGGTLDVVSGELVVDRARTTVGDLTWERAVVGKFYSTSLKRSIKKGSATYGYDNAISDCYEPNNIASVSSLTNGGMSIDSAGNVQIRDDRYETASEFKTAMANATIVYELATPQTIQLTPQQVELLKGANNVWSDEGEVRVIYEGNIPQDGSFEYPLEGEYTITYKATDKCGNEGTAERTIVVSPSE